MSLAKSALLTSAACRDVDDEARDGQQCDRGATLIELLVTVMIVGLAVVALLAGLSTAIIVSDQHRQQAVAGAAVHSFAEAVAAMAATNYVECATTATYETHPGYASPTGYTSTVNDVTYWDPGTRTFSASANCPGSDSGAQKVSLKVASNQGRATETLDIIVRKAGA